LSPEGSFENTMVITRFEAGDDQFSLLGLY